MLGYTPHTVYLGKYVDNIYVPCCGVDRDLSTAIAKARSEMYERLWTSDLMNPDDTEGLVTYKTRNRWCSTGSAAHPDKDVALLKSQAELIERDTIASWMAFGVPVAVVASFGERYLLHIPCRFAGWHVAACARFEDDRKRCRITGGAGQTWDAAAKAAYEESFLSNTLVRGDSFLSSNLPWLPFTGSVRPSGNDRLPGSVRLREWHVDGLHITRMWSPQLSDFLRGLTDYTRESYQSYIGGTWQIRKVRRSWFT